MDQHVSPSEGPFALLRPHWRLVLACFLGWFLDAFDQVALLLVLPEIGKHFDVSLTAMGLVITAQSLGRILGNVGWGWLADRYGRKLTFMIGVIWFAAFSGMSGLAWSYGALFVVQFLFGMGFGGEWTASAALLMETVPVKASSVASSLMMAGYEFGFFAAAGAQAILLPAFGWRSLFLVGVVPAVLAIFIRVGIQESPVWLRMQQERASEAASRRKEPARATGAFRLDAAAWQACLFMAALQFQTAAVYNFYPTLLKVEHGFAPDGIFAAVAAYSIGSIGGKLLCGWATSRLGERAVVLVCIGITMAGIVPFAGAGHLSVVTPTALLLGASSSGVFALVPHFLSQRFADAVRSFGMGVAYAVAAFTQGIATFVIPATGRDFGLAHAMEAFVVLASLLMAVVIAREPKDIPGRGSTAPALP